MIQDNSVYPPLTINTPEVLNCEKTSVTLNGFSPIGNSIVLRWATINGTDTLFLGNGNNVNVSQIGTYFLIGIDPANGCRNANSTTVLQNKVLPVVSSGSDKTIDCAGTALKISGTSSAPNSTFAWAALNGGTIQSGANAPQVTVSSAGTYVLTATNNQNKCAASDTVIVVAPNAITGNIQSQNPLCFGESNGTLKINMSGGQPPYRFKLNGVDYGNSGEMNGLSAGVYQVQVTDNLGCVWLKTATIVAPQKFFTDLGSDLTMNFGDSIRLMLNTNVPLNNLKSVTWLPADLFHCPDSICIEQYVSPKYQVTVKVKAIDKNGCQASDEIIILVLKDFKVFVPNIFSPNDDGANDIFYIRTKGDDVEKINKLQVFDRWGSLLFNNQNFPPNDPDQGWNGRFNGSVMTPAVFVYYAEILFKDGHTEIVSGDVTLNK